MNRRQTIKWISLFVPATVLLVSISVLSSILPKSHGAGHRRVATATDCRHASNLNDYQMNECLTTSIRETRTRLDRALVREAAALGTGSLRRGEQVVTAAESAYDHYVRAECLAEATPYRGGTLQPIVFGTCEVTLLGQRLALVRKQVTASLAN